MSAECGYVSVVMLGAALGGYFPDYRWKGVTQGMVVDEEKEKEREEKQA